MAKATNPEPRISFCCCSLRLDKNLKRLSHCPPVEGPLSAILCNRQLCQSSFISQFSFVLLHTHAVIILHSGRQGDSRLHFHSISTLTGSLGTPSSMELYHTPYSNSILHTPFQSPIPVPLPAADKLMSAQIFELSQGLSYSYTRKIY